MAREGFPRNNCFLFTSILLYLFWVSLSLSPDRSTAAKKTTTKTSIRYESSVNVFLVYVEKKKQYANYVKLSEKHLKLIVLVCNYYYYDIIGDELLLNFGSKFQR